MSELDKTLTMTSTALRSAYILTWTIFLPSILGFHLTNNSPWECHKARSIMAPRQFLPNRRMTSGIQLRAIWGPASSSSSSSGGEDSEKGDVTKDMDNSAKDFAVTDPSISSIDVSSNDLDDATNSSTTSGEKSLLALVNDIGNNFKAMAQKSTSEGYQCEDQTQKILFAAKACLYYTLFIIYRSYRGLFVLLPATFRQVYSKMEAAMNTGNLSLEEVGFTENGEDIKSTTSSWRTKITVSILTSVITISYVVGGIVKMTSRFLRTIAKTSDVPKSFGAAADEVLEFEGRVSRVGKVNGEDKNTP